MERLTDTRVDYTKLQDNADIDEVVEKLGKLEDLLEKHEIGSVKELEWELKKIEALRLLVKNLQDSNFLKRQELDKYHDIEQELGIDLITLFKALKQGYVWYGSKGELYKYEIECVYIKPIIHLYVADGVGECCFKDYGKTWALTEEVLEK